MTTDTKTVADGFTALCKAGKFDDAGAQYWGEDVVSLENGGDMARAEGLAAVKGKGEWWAANHEIHSAETEGPFVNGDQFAVVFQMHEIATYTVKGGKIVEERFYY